MIARFCYPMITAVVVLCGCSPSDEQGAGRRPSLAVPQQAPALPDFSQFTDVKAKKQAFFSYLEPMIEQENQHIRQLRDYLRLLQQQLERRSELNIDDQHWLAQVSRRYRVPEGQPDQQLDALLAKLGEIPAALVKAQAANESAWGTSRFARQANNLFGQWCFTPGCGIEPMQRGPEQNHEVKAFNNIGASLRSYFTNLNGHQSYADLRQIRRCLDQQQLPLTARALAAGLVNYSARGGHYVEELRSMIRHNRLESWKANWWGDQQPEHPCYPLVQTVANHPDPIVAPAAEPLDASPLLLSDSDQQDINLPLAQDQ